MVQEKQQTAFVSEIFSSAQGEGVHIGRRQLFVRLCGCHRNCLYCDTDFERKGTFNVEREPGSGVFEQVPNPISVNQLIKLLHELNRSAFAHDDLFITGGEPLLQADFLAEFLPEAHKQLNLPVHLETSGDLVVQFIKIAEHIDHVLMDIKLPSVTGESATWEAHQRFMEKIGADEISATIKLVVSADTSEEDLAEAVELITATETRAHVVLQPMTAAVKTDRIPTAKQVLTWQSQMASALGHSVRVIPQCHKLMGLL
ncbi:MAG: 7-carboxy-7-deazaguanine synthase QueE [Kiritimatiellales bacterium]|nr:7-carboxy-7-deazaguanine synthase QueE [Kiritimatiellota bacterium]MBL7011844.1 7-carboxy-7-deazaguanine synthase QueE [Kiritimatiellales bacterium]